MGGLARLQVDPVPGGPRGPGHPGQGAPSGGRHRCDRRLFGTCPHGKGRGRPCLSRVFGMSRGRRRAAGSFRRWAACYMVVALVRPSCLWSSSRLGRAVTSRVMKSFLWRLDRPAHRLDRTV